jgi:hypothetical protein
MGNFIKCPREDADIYLNEDTVEDAKREASVMSVMDSKFQA